MLKKDLRIAFKKKREALSLAEIDEKSLANIADKTGGQYFRARDSQGMSDIYALLDQLEPVEQEQQQMRPLSALYYWPLSFAVLLCFVYLLSLHSSLLLPNKSVDKNNANFRGGN